MRLANNKSDRDAFDRIKNWLASNPEIPRFRRRANKAAICRQAGIARSTADANPEIRALLAILDLKVMVVQRGAPTHAPKQKNTAQKIVASPSPSGRSWLTPANCHSLALEHFLQTGRVVR